MLSPRCWQIVKDREKAVLHLLACFKSTALMRPRILATFSRTPIMYERNIGTTAQHEPVAGNAAFGTRARACGAKKH